MFSFSPKWPKTTHLPKSVISFLSRALKTKSTRKQSKKREKLRSAHPPDSSIVKQINEFKREVEDYARFFLLLIIILPEICHYFATSPLNDLGLN